MSIVCNIFALINFFIILLTQQQLADRLSALLKNKGITQHDLSESLGKSQPYISKYMRGEVKIPVEVLYTISNLLEISINDLLSPDYTSDPPSKDDDGVLDVRVQLKALRQDVDLLKKIILENF